MLLYDQIINVNFVLLLKNDVYLQGSSSSHLTRSLCLWVFISLSQRSNLIAKRALICTCMPEMVAPDQGNNPSNYDSRAVGRENSLCHVLRVCMSSKSSKEGFFSHHVRLLVSQGLPAKIFRMSTFSKQLGQVSCSQEYLLRTTTHN